MTLVVLRRRETRRAEIVERKNLPVADDVLIVDQVVQRQVGHRLGGLRVGEVDVERHLVRQSVQVEQLALDRRIDGPERHAGPHAHLAVGPV